VDQRLVTGLWQASSSGRVWARGVQMWLEDGPLSIMMPLPYFPFFLNNVQESYDVSKLSEAEQLALLRFFLLHGIRPKIKTTGVMAKRFSQDGFVIAEDGVQVMNYPEKTTNIILRPNGQTAFVIMDAFFQVMGLNQIIQTKLDVRMSPNVIVVDTKFGSKFVYFKETGFRRVRVAGLEYIVHVVDYWDPGRRQVPVVRERKRPGMQEGIEEDPGPSLVILFLYVLLFMAVSLLTGAIKQAMRCDGDSIKRECHEASGCVIKVRRGEPLNKQVLAILQEGNFEIRRTDEQNTELMVQKIISQDGVLGSDVEDFNQKE